MMTVDQALARIMELHRMPPPDAEMRQRVRQILDDVRSAGYREGGDNERYDH
jgi:hypothetical protein